MAGWYRATDEPVGLRAEGISRQDFMFSARNFGDQPFRLRLLSVPDQFQEKPQTF